MSFLFTFDSKSESIRLYPEWARESAFKPHRLSNVIAGTRDTKTLDTPEGQSPHHEDTPALRQKPGKGTNLLKWPEKFQPEKAHIPR
jgi:hypothetical protein